MKKLKLITPAIVLSLFFNSCSSPEKDGNKRGLTFCNCMTDVNSYSSSSLLQEKKANCDKASLENLDNTYNTDAEKLKKFRDAFENTTQKTMSDYNSALTALITKELSEKVWVKEDETNNDFYLCFFNKGTFYLLNCKEDFDFKLSGDNIVFDDNKKTSGTIKITDKKLILTNSEQTSNAVYRLADEKDKLIGKWTFISTGGTYFVVFSLRGSATVRGSNYVTETTTYTLDNKTLNIKGSGAYKMNIENDDVFKWQYATCSRVKSKKPENLKSLFIGNEMIKKNEAPSAKEANTVASPSNRPEKTEEKLRGMVYMFDSKVADVSSTLRELKQNIEKGAKVTPKINENITKMIEDAKKLREPILSQTDKLSDKEFSEFDRDKDWIDKLDTEFESVKQTTKTSE